MQSGQLTGSSTVFSEVNAVRGVIHHNTWNKGEQMDLTVRKIAEGNMTVRNTAVSYSILKSTLHNHIKGKCSSELV